MHLNKWYSDKKHYFVIKVNHRTMHLSEIVSDAFLTFWRTPNVSFKYRTAEEQEIKARSLVHNILER
jgi:hypothetical protein